MFADSTETSPGGTVTPVSMGFLTGQLLEENQGVEPIAANLMLKGPSAWAVLRDRGEGPLEAYVDRLAQLKQNMEETPPSRSGQFCTPAFCFNVVPKVGQQALSRWTPNAVSPSPSNQAWSGGKSTGLRGGQLRGAGPCWEDSLTACRVKPPTRMFAAASFGPQGWWEAKWSSRPAIQEAATSTSSGPSGDARRTLRSPSSPCISAGTSRSHPAENMAEYGERCSGAYAWSETQPPGVSKVSEASLGRQRSRPNSRLTWIQWLPYPLEFHPA